ncbi:IS4 family transposase [Candidatus Margulisiibacteriota bacterium]
MKSHQTVFSQLLYLIPTYQFQRIVNKYNGDKHIRKFNCWSQFCAIFYAQLRQMDTLRGIATGLDVHLNKLYHLGIKPIKRSTFSDANNKKDFKIYEGLFNLLLDKCKKLSQHRFSFHNPIRSIDATVIDLCYAIFPWKKYRTRKGALKMHVELANESYLPETVVITDGKKHEINIARELKIKPDSIYVVDRAYIDYAWLHSIHKQKAKFVVRAKKDMNFSVVGQHDICDPESNVLADEDIQTPYRYSKYPSKKSKYPDILRKVTYQDPETGKIYQFLTNIENYKPETIALIYKQRWQIELFFKWIKQNLKIKSFIGASKNAVLTQIWIAMIVYLILWYIKHQSRYQGSLLLLTRIMNEALFEHFSIFDLLGISLPNPSVIKNIRQLSFGFG